VAAADVLRQEWREGVQASDIYARDLRWLADCDLVIADVSVPSLGVGVEIAEAQHLGKPVWCLCREDVELSAMVAGNRTLRIIRYTHEADLLDRLERELTPSAVGGG
jgi:nucleoside 2-deoxyribosyltransferase